MTTRRRRTEPPEGAVPLFAECRHCGECYDPTESSIEGVCPTCESERYSTCPECRQTRANRDFVTLEGGRSICRACANTIACRCDECGRWHLIDEASHITDRHGDGDAAAARILQEFGSDWLYFKRDGSLDDGVELVTHPISPAVMMSDEVRGMWARISEIALEEGLRSHDTRTCGLHVHVNRDYFGKGALAQEMAELKLNTIADRFFEPLTIFSRRNRDLLHRWAKRPMLPRTEDGWRKRAKCCHDMSCTDRYRAVNVTNEATIEFRLFRGTLKVDTLMATFQFVSGLCAVAKASSVGKLEKMTWYELCDEVIMRLASTWLCPMGRMEFMPSR